MTDLTKQVWRNIFKRFFIVLIAFVVAWTIEYFLFGNVRPTLSVGEVCGVYALILIAEEEVYFDNLLVSTETLVNILGGKKGTDNNAHDNDSEKA